jgi:rod shape-determining protein MreC
MRRLTIPAVVLLVLVLGGLFTMGPRVTQRIQGAVLGAIAPFLKTGSSWQKQFSALREGLKTLEQLEKENQELAVQNQELRAVNQTLRGLEEDNNKLRRALNYRERAIFHLVPARIIARDASSWWNTVKIDRGFADGVESDMPVLTESGLVGKTTTVAKNAATVLLIADESCKVAVTVEGTREQGIARGERTSTTAMPEIGLNFLSKDANLTSGQHVVTSGVGGVYPPGVQVGVVKEFKSRPLDGFATIVPAVDLTTLEDLFVVTGKKK